MTNFRDLRVTSLLLDSENPRLADGLDGQPSAIEAMLRTDPAKMLALAASVVEDGLSPAEHPLVIPSPADSDRFVVLEGNRRVTACKILLNPKLAENVFSKQRMKQLQDLSARFLKERRPVIACAIVDSRDSATTWIARRHRGEQGGVGVVPWGATESARFDARHSGTAAPELQVLDYVKARGGLDASTLAKLDSLSITNLRRLIRDKQVRKALGLEFGEQDELRRRFAEGPVLKALTRIVTDLAEKRILVRDIYDAKKRKTYLNSFAKSELPRESQELDEAVPLSANQSGQAAPASTPGVRPARRARPRGPRLTMVPGEFRCGNTDAKVTNVCKELQKLRLEQFPNAISVLFRVFLELTVDTYIATNHLMPENELSNAKLGARLTKVAQHLANVKVINSKQANAVRMMAQDQHLSGGVKTLHEFVHSSSLAATPTTLRVTWDNLEPFFHAVWDEERQ